MSEHARLGASACKRWWNCPGCLNYTEGMPNVETPYAREGTHAHKLAELCLTARMDAEEYIGRDVGGLGVVTAEMAEHVQVYLDDCRAGGAGPQFEFIEKRVDLAELEPPGPMFGTADYLQYVPEQRRLKIKDLKYGAGVNVVADGNPQLKYYALGALLLPKPENWGPIREIEASIVQPRAPVGAPVRRVMLDPIELTEWSMELMTRARATLDPAAPLNPGEWCKFCLAAGRCKAQAAQAIEMAADEWSGMIVENQQWHQQVAMVASEPAPVVGAIVHDKLLTFAEMAALHLKAAQIKQFLTDNESAIVAALRAGHDVPGLKMVANNPNPVYIDPDKAAVTLMLDHDMAESEIMTKPELLSQAQVRGVLAAQLHTARMVEWEKDHGKKPTKKAALEDAKAILAPLIHRKSTGTTLVPTSDPRPAIAAPDEVFDVLPAPLPDDEVT